MPIEELKRPERIDEDRIEKLKELFPEAFGDGKLNLEILKSGIEAINEDLIEESAEEFYGLQWVGKKEARKLSYLPPQGTLRIAKGEGINEGETNNFLIEGDNLEVLRVLQKSYRNRIKVIFIDPPYNTGHDFIYKDDFKEPVEKYLQKVGQADETGLLTSNPKASGRFHADWLNMMYPRLKLAKNLLTDDGVIFVCIDDNEQANLKKILDEIFGEDNFVTNIVWKHTQQSKNDEPYFSRHHNSILVYRKSSKLEKIRMERTEEDNKAYSNPDNDPKGLWRSGDVRSPSLRKTLKYNITTPSGKVILPPDNGWRWSQETLLQKIETGEIIFNGDETKIIRKIYLADQEGRTPENVWLGEFAGTTREATNELKELFGGTSPFDTPKPTKLIKRAVKLVSKEKGDLVLDFFAGSGTTAQAVLELNEEDNINRNFILVQIPEEITDDEFPTISEITKERIRLSIAKLNTNENTNSFDRGFAVFKMDKSNLRKWKTYSGVNKEHLENELNLFTSSPFLEHAEDEDLVIELMLSLGYPLDSMIEKRTISSNSLWVIYHLDIPSPLIACLDEKVDKSAEGLLLDSFEKATFICLDNALTNEQKILLSESMNVKTI